MRQHLNTLIRVAVVRHRHQVPDVPGVLDNQLNFIPAYTAAARVLH
jgi:hypothetical protein